LALYNAIANDGGFVRPRLVKEIRGSGKDRILPIDSMGSGRACSPATAAVLRQMLTNVVWGEHGTGKFLRNDLVRIAGKTGTCYMIENGSYNTAKKRLAFCGFFPAENPRYSCIVLTCYPKRKFLGAATTSGQVVKNIAMKLYSRGMLGGNPDYTAGITGPVGATFFASAVKGVNPGLKTALAMPAGRRELKAPVQRHGGVPDVRGYGIRDAIVALEKAGYEVSFKGTGYVASQSPSAGNDSPRGTMVNLSLSH
ncbi:MAG: PASTA domain-containing protein, partial [Duncaniella sp.]|nr:PASTA domain-containing protein [Duncaniella sp.]